eukprot:scaffold13902_cov173-Amphora_coffeaeformis.AAC.2
MTKASALLWVLLLATTSTSQAQFTCTLTANDEGSCLGTKADDGNHCVWCAVSSFGFCVSETQAESMESNIPGVQCDRYSGDDDDNASTDDDATPDGTDDDAPSPNDDALPPDYWKCLENKDAADCLGAGCTWCDSKAGFGLCLTGPSADMAEESDWFTCKKNDEQLELVADPYDTSCVTAYLENPTQQGCISTSDADGVACLWCSLAGMTNLCLSQEQADMASQLGVTCEQEHPQASASLRGQQQQPAVVVNDPYDTSCLMAYLQDPTADGCTSATDEDGQACEFCTFQDNINLCLTEEQATMGEQLGIECKGGEEMDQEEGVVKDPYDPSCAIAYLQDQSEAACKAALDSDGNPCEYCTLQGAIKLCLNEEQARVGEQLGIECDGRNTFVFVEDNEEDPYDPSCAIAYLQDQSEATCKAAIDADGNPCEYCTLQGAMNLCLNEEQAEMAEQLGAECDSRVEVAAEAEDDNITFPSDFWACLENYDEGGCGVNSCTWCTTEVGIGFCMSDAVADAMRECTFFDCRYKQQEESVQAVKPFDAACLQGAESQDACRATLDSEGEACVWCDGAGVFGLCLSSDGAEAAGEYLMCNEMTAVA